MSVTVDANVLLYASDEASPFHRRALELVAELARGPELVYLFWPTTMAYLRIATHHPAIFGSPPTLSEAAANVDRLLDLPRVQTAGEHPQFWRRFLNLAADADARGNLVPERRCLGSPCRGDGNTAGPNTCLDRARSRRDGDRANGEIGPVSFTAPPDELIRLSLARGWPIPVKIPLRKRNGAASAAPFGSPLELLATADVRRAPPLRADS